MITQMSNQNWANLATIFGALTVLAGTIYVARSSRKATDRSTEVAGQAQIVDNYSQILADVRTEMVQLRARVEKLEKRAEQAEQRYGMAIRYIRQILGWIAERLPDVQPPPVPAGIAQDLDQ